jgi:hypothetical protein
METIVVHCKTFMRVVFRRRSFKPLRHEIERIYAVT